jgi:high frequency lysogenization protein
MSLNNISNQTIALAGLAQACALVHQLATTGKADNNAFESSIGSVLKIDADSVQDVYGNLQGIKLGLQELDRQLGGKLLNSPEQARYAAQLVYLQKQLTKRTDMLSTIHTGISKAQHQAVQFGALHPNVQANLADIYHNTLSTLQPRIMVVGDQQCLSNQSTVNKIRALLLAGIRASLLWRQCGGSRWKLLLFRKKLQDETRYLLTQC